MWEPLERPSAQFRQWFMEAVSSGVASPHVLVCVGRVGAPPAAELLHFGGWDEHGYRFGVTSTRSLGQAVACAERASLVFDWTRLNRQVVIEGRLEALQPEVSDDIFSRLPRPQTLHAWLEEVPLEAWPDAKDALRARVGEAPVPRPETWLAWRVHPERMEFVQDGLLPARATYRVEGGGWEVQRAPV